VFFGEPFIIALPNSQIDDMSATPYRFLLVDGTKVHLQGPKGEELGKAEMRWAMASFVVLE